MLGVQAGTAATEAQVRAVFGRLEHPTRVDAEDRRAAAAGQPAADRSGPGTEREAQALAAEPDATEERRAEIQQQGLRATPQGGGLLRPDVLPGQVGERVLDRRCWWPAATPRRRTWSRRTGPGWPRRWPTSSARPAYVRSGYHGKTTSGQSVGVYEQARGLAWVRWDHSTSRAQQPQLHSHVTVLNRAETISDGAIAGAGQPRVQADQAGRRRDLHPDLSSEMLSRLQRGGVRHPRGRQGRARSSGSTRSCWPRRPPARLDVNGAAGRAGRRSSSRPTAGIRVPVETASGSTGRRGGRPGRPRTTRWRRAEQLANWAAPVRARGRPGGDRGRRGTPRGSPGTGTPTSRATPGAAASRCCARRCARCRTATPTWDIGNLAAAIVERAGPHARR